MQALILAGGEGTRLRPLTSTIPKPVIPVVNRPFIAYMLEWLRGHGVDDVVLACGFMAGGVQAVLGDGGDLGMRLRYLHEPHPLGTGGALKFAAGQLQERFYMLNGDVLTDIDLTAQLEQHERTGARATLALIAVADPSAYGLVDVGADGAVQEFLEKPGVEPRGVNLVNAGAYILERDVLEAIAPAPANVSIERDVFPMLVGHGLYGREAHGYWLDIGTPERYLQASFDILEGRLETEVGRRLGEAGLVLVDGATIEGHVVAPVLVAPGCVVAAAAVVGGRAVLGPGARVGEGTHVQGSVLLAGASVGAHSSLSGSILGPGAVVGDRCRIEDGAVLGAGVKVGPGSVVAPGAKVGPGSVVAPGARIFPGMALPEGTIDA